MTAGLRGLVLKLLPREGGHVVVTSYKFKVQAQKLHAAAARPGMNGICSCHHALVDAALMIGISSHGWILCENIHHGTQWASSPFKHHDACYGEHMHIDSSCTIALVYTYES